MIKPALPYRSAILVSLVIVLIGSITLVWLAAKHRLPKGFNFQPNNVRASDPLVPDTNYPIPAGAKFVDNSGGSDSNTGSQASPWASLTHAIASTAAGGTIVLRAGYYHESVNLGSKALTIQPYPHEQVWLDGSQRITSSAFVPSGTTWKLANSPSQNLCGVETSCVADNRMVDPNYPMAWSPQMVFEDGVPLHEVGTLANVGAGRFYFDNAANAIYIGDNPSGKMIEITTLIRAITISGSNGARVRGIGIRRYGAVENNATDPAMVVVINGNNSLLENDVFYESASRDVQIQNTSGGATIRSSLFTQDGMNGASGNNVTGLNFDSNIVSFNNTEHFSNAVGAIASVAGVKLTSMTNAKITNNIFDHNNAHGFWCDLGCSNTLIMSNLVHDNLGHGLFYEVSYTGTIISNLIYNNQGYGLKIMAQNSRVYNNTFVNNLSENIFLYDDGRTPNPTGNAIVNNVSARLVDGGSGNVGTGLIHINPLSGGLTPAQMATTLDYDFYYRTSGTSTKAPTNVLQWGGTNFATFSASTINSSIGREAHGKGLDSINVSSSSQFVNPSLDNYQLASGSLGHGAGATLPNDIAGDLNVPPSPVNIGAIAWASQQRKPGDINNDGSINSTDLAILASNFGRTGMTIDQGDLNSDGRVGLGDLAILAFYWGT